MRLSRLWIKEFKNLRNFEIIFDPDSPYTVLVGRNGSGKSNLFEAMVRIFDSLESDDDPPFRYQLRYRCRGRIVDVDGDPDRKRAKTVFQVSPKGGEDKLEPIAAGQFHEEKDNPEKRLLPEFIFGYYSGCCERFKGPFDRYQKEYAEAMRRLETGEGLSRRFLYGDLSFANLIIVALWAHTLKGPRRSRILQYLNIDQLTDVNIRLRPPGRFDPNQHDPKSMGLGGLLREFVAELEFTAKDAMVHGSGKDIRKCYLLSEESLEKLAAFSEKRTTNLFSLLLSAEREAIIDSFSCCLKLDTGLAIHVDDLSEGEKQLLLVLGMLRFAEHEEALFLLDEPDTHLNPRWSVQYLDIVEKELGHRPKSHIVLATHDPLLLVDLDGSQVQVLGRDDKTGCVTAAPFQRSPKEMGVDGLLTCDLFELRASIGNYLQEKINRRAVLLGRGNKMTKEERTELQTLTHELSRMGFGNAFADPIYTQFVAAMGKRPEFMKPVLTPREMAEQERFATKILDRIMKEKRE